MTEEIEEEEGMYLDREREVAKNLLLAEADITLIENRVLASAASSRQS